MSQILIIEPDKKHFQEIKDILSELDEKIQTFHFTEVTDFTDRLNHSIKNKSTEPADLHPDQISLIIADLDTSSAVTTALWGKILGYIRASKTEKAKSKAPPRLILTAFQNEERTRDFSQYVDPSIFTILLKPFDSILTKQNFRLALAPPGPLQTEDVFSQKKEATIEIVKDIKIDRMTELGFRTLSSRKIPMGKISRYFGSPLEGPGENSVFAYCFNNEPDTKKPELF